MSEPTEVSDVERIADVRHEALRKLRSASEDILLQAERMRADMVQIIGQVQDGLHTKDVNHQTCFDLKAAIVLRQSYATTALAAGCTSGDVVKASRGL